MAMGTARRRCGSARASVTIVVQRGRGVAPLLLTRSRPCLAPTPRRRCLELPLLPHAPPVLLSIHVAPRQQAAARERVALGAPRLRLRVPDPEAVLDAAVHGLVRCRRR
jgi:hypothetical protein